MTIVQLAALLVAAAVFLAGAMAMAWRIQQASGNSGWIDTIWSAALGVVAVGLALFPIAQSDWPGDRQILVALLVGIWSLRLAWHIYVRTRNMGDDPRYRKMMTEWGADAASNLFWHLQIQASVSVLLVSAILLAAHNPVAFLRPQDIVGVLVLFVGISGEALADYQLRRFKALSANQGRICDVGLWRYSRHPNYFFDWLCWLSYPLLAIDFGGANPLGPLALLAPICMYWILVHVSGIPPLEAHMMRTREEAFRAYQRRTRPFFPLPLLGPRRTA